MKDSDEFSFLKETFKSLGNQYFDSSEIIIGPGDDAGLVKNSEDTVDVYEFYEIKKDLSEQKPIVENSELPERALIILGIIFGIVVLVGLKLRKNY